MTEYRYAVETLNDTDEWRDRFAYGHAAPRDVTPGLSDNATHKQIRVVLPRPPDMLAERYSGDPASPFRAATRAEIDAVTDARDDAEATREIDEVRALKAMGRVIAELTGTSPARVRSRFRHHYRSS